MINRRQDNSKDVDAGITNALRELPRIEAPAGFQTAVADRIRRKESRQGFPWLVPAAVTMCALIVFVLVGLYVLNNESSTPQISSASNGSGIEKEVASDSATATDPNATDIPNDLGNSVLEVPPATMSANRSTADKARQTRRETAATPTRPGQELGGSIERAANPARDPIMPIGIPTPGMPTNSAGTAKPPVGDSRLEVADVLALFGIDAALEGGRWEVKGLAGGSIAERSGIQKGDVIVSIGERNVGSAQTIESGRIADSITVKRDNQQKDIRLIRP